MKGEKNLTVALTGLFSRRTWNQNNGMEKINFLFSFSHPSPLFRDVWELGIELERWGFVGHWVRGRSLELGSKIITALADRRGRGGEGERKDVHSAFLTSSGAV